MNYFSLPLTTCNKCTTNHTAYDMLSDDLKRSLDRMTSNKYLVKPTLEDMMKCMPSNPDKHEIELMKQALAKSTNYTPLTERAIRKEYWKLWNEHIQMLRLEESISKQNTATKEQTTNALRAQLKEQLQQSLVDDELNVSILEKQYKDAVSRVRLHDLSNDNTRKEDSYQEYIKPPVVDTPIKTTFKLPSAVKYMMKRYLDISHDVFTDSELNKAFSKWWKDTYSVDGVLTKDYRFMVDENGNAQLQVKDSVVEEKVNSMLDWYSDLLKDVNQKIAFTEHSAKNYNFNNRDYNNELTLLRELKQVINKVTNNDE
jgi:hypothetical protein